MKRWRSRLFWIVVLSAIWLFCSGAATATPLTDRLANYPNWEEKPPVQAAIGDLIYPDWFAGTWEVTTTLVDLVAPLAPDIVSPGFESNRQFLEQPIPFQAKFVETGATSIGGYFATALRRRDRSQVVADRAFNGLSLARSYLGDDRVLAVNVDPQNPNRQITTLKGDRQLVSTITARATEAPTADDFLTTEVFQQSFRGLPQVYFNIVETTTAYHHQPEDQPEALAAPAIVADQVTAIYASPQDPDYFKIGDRPVALYRYRLEFSPGSLTGSLTRETEGA